MMVAQEIHSKTQEQLMISQEEREKAGRACGTAGTTGYESLGGKVKVARISVDKAALKALYEKADKFD
jgi:hypothetical protein